MSQNDVKAAVTARLLPIHSVMLADRSAVWVEPRAASIAGAEWLSGWVLHHKAVVRSVREQLQHHGLDQRA
jgi:hypothetical protein